MDAHTLLVSTLDSERFGQRNLTVMAYLSNTSSGDLRYGGAEMYRQLLPFFLGLTEVVGADLGDFANGGLWTLMGCIFDIHVYPVNW